MVQEKRGCQRGARTCATILGVVASVTAFGHLGAQEAHPLRDLISDMRRVNPEIAAAHRIANAGDARISQAGALPDPVLTAGLMNVPASSFDLGQEGMTMASIQVGQRLPAPGTGKAREEIATRSHGAAVWQSDEVALDLLHRLKSAYYEVLFVDEAVTVITRNRALLVDLAEIAEAGFALGRTPQHDVLRAQTEITRLDEQLAGLRARRAAMGAEINAILQRSASEPLSPVYPEAIRALALAPLPRGAFTAAALEGSMGAGLPPLHELQRRAEDEHPLLRAHVDRIGAAQAEVRLAERQRFPDVDLMLGYGKRWDRGDMLSMSISAALPIFATRKQDQAVAAAGHELAAEELRHHQMIADLRSEIAARHAALVRTREQIVLLSDGVVPQADATLESAAAAYQSGQIEFLGLLDAQATLFRNEVELARRLSDFGRELAALERAVGVELGLEDGP